ncbi:MAG: hypothetical protein IKW34_01960 [Clostridia bacterium]|nr:hypothetical protein [Clostridia bacterium]
MQFYSFYDIIIKNKKGKIIMLTKIKSFLQENKISYTEKPIKIADNDVLQIRFELKKFFKKYYNLFFIESNNMNEIENIVVLLSEKEELFSTYVYLFCKTELEMSNDKLTYIGTNGNQIIDCIYYDEALKDLKYNNDIDTPNIIKQLIKYLTA